MQCYHTKWLRVSSTIILLALQLAQGDYEIRVNVGRYRNEGHLNSRGCCWFSLFDLRCIGDCDNYFLFCLRPFQFSSLDKTCPSGEVLTGAERGDHRTFTDTINGHPNPVLFELTGRWEGSFQLRIDVLDGGFVDTFVDEIFSEPTSFPLGGSFSAPTWYMGAARLSRMELSFQVRCKESFYGTDCNTFCASDVTRYSCDGAGNRVCRPGYFVLPECGVYCVPEAGRYECDAESGERICEENYYTATCELYCPPTPNNYTCDQLNGTLICLNNYFGEDCKVFCKESTDEVAGFYTCDPLTGEKECVQGYVDPDTNCTIPNEKKATANGTLNVMIVVVSTLVVVIGILAFSLMVVVLVARHVMAAKRPAASRDLHQTLLDNDDHTPESISSSAGSPPEEEWIRNLNNPLYREQLRQVSSESTKSSSSLVETMEDPLYCSVRSAVRVNISHL